MPHIMDSFITQKYVSACQVNVSIVTTVMMAYEVEMKKRAKSSEMPHVMHNFIM